jgi:hypothetical protein
MSAEIREMRCLSTRSHGFRHFYACFMLSQRGERFGQANPMSGDTPAAGVAASVTFTRSMTRRFSPPWRASQWAFFSARTATNSRALAVSPTRLANGHRWNLGVFAQRRKKDQRG